MSTIIRQEESAAALRLIAERNKAAGRAADDYSNDEYIEAFETVSAQVSRSVLWDALEVHGFDRDGDEIVTEAALQRRIDEILGEAGFNQMQNDGTMNVPTREEQLAAALQAIDEIGVPGEKRKDLPKRAAAMQDRLIETALDEGAIAEEQVQTYRDLFAKDAPFATSLLLRLTESRREVVAAHSSGGGRVDNESLDLHLAAEELLRGAGFATVDGSLEYENDDYMTAVVAAQETGNAVAAVDAEVRAYLRGTGEITPSLYMASVPRAAGIVAVAIAESAESEEKPTSSVTGVRYDREAHETALAVARDLGITLS